LIKTGTISKQDYDRRNRDYEAAVAAVQTFTSQRDQALAQIANSEAELDRIQSMIDDLTIVSPRLARVQYQLHHVGEVVSPGAPIVTILDLTDMYMTMFLAAADASRLRVGEEARIILDPVPDYVIPATISFVAADAEFTPKWVEITNERTELSFRVKLQINPQLLEEFSSRMKTGVLGLGFVRTNPGVQWPEDLQVKLPKPPQTRATDTKSDSSARGAPSSNDK
jgi:HlyD family secretion protein